MPNDLWRLDAYTLAIGQSVDGRLQVTQLAGLGSRFGAGLLDLGLQAITGGALFYLFRHLRPDLLSQAGERFYWYALAGAIEWHVIYSLLFEAFTRGRTPGKAACGITVMPRSGRGLASPYQILVRNIMRLLDFLPLAYVAGGISALRSSSHQRLGDLLAGTVVVYNRSMPEQLAAAGVPDSIFSSSEDGYLLQAFVERSTNLRQETRTLLAMDLARYLITRYSLSEATVRQAYDAGNYEQCLKILHDLERQSEL